ncbi:hypothetical protein LTR86_009970 [Recurvomyces mirabilis]|nr:hypothetical protein LTR86_009970 [Recurvomyces mirabilis]
MHDSSAAVTTDGEADRTPYGTHRAPVYFLSVGGPNTIEDTAHPAYARLASVGREITERVRPKAVVVISAHWQEHSDKIAINVAENPGLIYDFRGFPPKYYQIEYPYRGSLEVAEAVTKKLGTAGITVRKVKRGLDHGVWVGFMAAFNPDTNPLAVPIVQVSLYDNEDLEQHYRFGQALSSLRDDGVLIIGAGMAAHNLPDFRAMRLQGVSRTMPYCSPYTRQVSMMH